MSRPPALDCLVRWLALTVVGAGLVALTPTHLPGALAGSIIIAAAFLRTTACGGTVARSPWS